MTAFLAATMGTLVIGLIGLVFYKITSNKDKEHETISR